MSNFSDQVFQIIKECFGAGGVTCASFAPAVTNTIYPRPGKKKKSKFRKKAEDVIVELSPEQLDALYSKDDEDTSEIYWKKPTSADYEIVKQKQAELDQKDEEAKRARLDKYKARNDRYLEKVNQTIELWSQQNDVNTVALHNWYNDAINKINKAEEDRQKYEKMPASEMKKLKQIKMQPISINFEYWRMRKTLPGEE